MSSPSMATEPMEQLSDSSFEPLSFPSTTPPLPKRLNAAQRRKAQNLPQLKRTTNSSKAPIRGDHLPSEHQLRIQGKVDPPSQPYEGETSLASAVFRSRTGDALTMQEVVYDVASPSHAAHAYHLKIIVDPDQVDHFILQLYEVATPKRPMIEGYQEDRPGSTREGSRDLRWQACFPEDPPNVKQRVVVMYASSRAIEIATVVKPPPEDQVEMVKFTLMMTPEYKRSSQKLWHRLMISSEAARDNRNSGLILHQPDDAPRPADDTPAASSPAGLKEFVIPLDRLGDLRVDNCVAEFQDDIWAMINGTYKDDANPKGGRASHRRQARRLKELENKRDDRERRLEEASAGEDTEGPAFDEDIAESSGQRPTEDED